MENCIWYGKVEKRSDISPMINMLARLLGRVGLRTPNIVHQHYGMYKYGQVKRVTNYNAHEKLSGHF